jgi:hypothetical protein
MPSCMACRYPKATYPMHPLMLRVSNPEGLDADKVKKLTHALNDMAAKHAKAAEVRNSPLNELA